VPAKAVKHGVQTEFGNYRCKGCEGEKKGVKNR